MSFALESLFLLVLADLLAHTLWNLNQLLVSPALICERQQAIS